MAYYFYLDKVLLPVAPSKLQLKINNQNKTLTLINDGEINILKKAKLTDIDFTVLIPQVKYPFALYKDGFKKATYYIEKLESLKQGQKPFQFIVTRTLPDGGMLFDTDMKVSLEEYQLIEDRKEGFDLTVSIKLKQYKDFGTKTAEILFEQDKPKLAPPSPPRPADPVKIGIGSNVIVTGRLHRDSYGSGPGMTLSNYSGKINFINLKGSHPYHVTSPNSDWMGWVTPESVKGV